MAKDFVSKILVKHSAQRLKLAQIKEHPWIVSNCALAELAKNKGGDNLKDKKIAGNVKIDEAEIMEGASKKIYGSF